MIHNYYASDGIILAAPLEEKDIEDLRSLRNSDAIREAFINSAVIDETEQAEWFKGYKTKPGDFMFRLRLAKEDVTVGFAALYNYTGSEAEFGRLMILPECQRKGYAKLAVKLLTKIAFETLTVDRLYLIVLNNNSRAVNLYKSLGFIMSEHDARSAYGVKIKETPM